MEQLSSHMSFACKFIVLPAIVGLFGYEWISAAIDMGRVDWVEAGLWLLISAVFYATFGRLKRVRFDGTQLWVSNWRREIAIPVGDIIDVYQQKWLATSPVTLTFASRNGFGESVQYMPSFSFGMWGEDPEVTMLREIAAASSAASD